MEEYQANPEVLEQLKEVQFVAVVGPTASGKTTLIREAMKQDPKLHMVRINTSRPRREGEVDGQEYHFRSREEMLARIARGEYAQVAPSLLGELYATAPEDYLATGTSLMPVIAAAVPMFRALPFASFRIIYILPPAYEEWQARITTHHFTPEQLRKRLDEAAQSLQFALRTPDIAVVVNDDLSTALQKFMDSIHGSSPAHLDRKSSDLAQHLINRIHTS